MLSLFPRALCVEGIIRCNTPVKVLLLIHLLTTLTSCRTHPSHQFLSDILKIYRILLGHTVYATLKKIRRRRSRDDVLYSLMEELSQKNE